MEPKSSRRATRAFNCPHLPTPKPASLCNVDYLPRGDITQSEMGFPHQSLTKKILQTCLQAREWNHFLNGDSSSQITLGSCQVDKKSQPAQSFPGYWQDCVGQHMYTLTTVKFSQLAMGGRLLGTLLPNFYGFDTEGKRISVENHTSDLHPTLLL